jgi:hypothetical protein
LVELEATLAWAEVSAGAESNVSTEQTEHKIKIRKQRKYKILKANTKRLKLSALPYIRRLLNNEHEMKNQVMKSI